LDPRGAPNPFLVERLPELSSGSWRVAADGTMETTYRLHAGLTWHDGQPLTADDFVFAFDVYSTPALGAAAVPPFSYIGDVVARDATTVVIGWKRTCPGAGGLGYDFPPLPRHILEAALGSLQADVFAALPFWTDEYVGAGPWKLEEWYLAGTANQRESTIVVNGFR
jgi:peptide/nickel transport system substrate-binding protein